MFVSRYSLHRNLQLSLVNLLVVCRVKYGLPLIAATQASGAGHGSFVTLAFAIVMQKVYVSGLLLKYGAGANMPLIVSDSDMTPLKNAASTGFTDIVEMLIDYIAEANHSVSIHGPVLPRA